MINEPSLIRDLQRPKNTTFSPTLPFHFFELGFQTKRLKVISYSTVGIEAYFS